MESKIEGPFSENGKSFIKDKWKLVPEYFKVGGLAKQHIQSYNYFINIGIKKIVEVNNIVTSSADPVFYLKYLDVKVGPPEIEETIEVECKSDPNVCRIADLSYAAPIFVDIEYIRGSQRIYNQNVRIGRMPIMLKSTHCVLNGKSKEELIKLKECPYDPGGYFLIKGSEKVILIQEQLALNQVLVDYDNKGEFYAQVRSMSNDKKTRCVVVMKKNLYYLGHNSFKEDVLVVALFKALGITIDYEIAKMIGHENEVISKLSYSLHECARLQIHTERQALMYLGSKIKPKQFGPFAHEKKSVVEEAQEFLTALLFSHIPVQGNNLIPKAMFLATTLRRLIQAQLNPEMKDDMDHVGNKRMEMAGSLLSLLFEDSFKRFNLELKLIADKLIPKVKVAAFDVKKHMRPDIITNALAIAIQTGNWTIKRFRMKRCGVTQVLSRLSYVATLGMMTRINSQFERTRKISGPRALQLSQWGMICPCDTPEGESCGLIKNLAFMTHITTNIDDSDIVRFIRHLGVENVTVLFGMENLYFDGVYMIYVNGRVIGATRFWKFVVASVRKVRRKGIISAFVSIYANHIHHSIFIFTDGGRLCRPYIRVSNSIPLITDKMIERLCKEYISFDDLTKQGYIEFLDVNEEGDSFIATREQEITAKTTHLEIAPFATLGVCAGIIPYAHHNQSPRNTYQCAMGKQALGIFGFNQFHRLDSVMHCLLYAQKPMVETKPIKCIHFDELPGGQNAIIAVMSYSGYDIEDSIVINRAAIERGYGRCQVYHSYHCPIKKYANSTTDRVLGPSLDSTFPYEPLRKHKILCPNGIAIVGEQATIGQVLVNKASPKIASTNMANQFPTYKEVPVFYKTRRPGYIDRVMLTSSSDGFMKFKVLIRQTRIPEVGDKFSSRHGQKGVIGFVANQEDMPFTEEGITPDIIMNPHGFPSRMTVGKLIELISAKSSAMTGQIHDATAFEDCKIEEIHTELIKNGFNYNGKDLLYSGITGEPMNAYIYIGPIYYQKLKHMVEDKIHARAKGPRLMLTRQPTEGRAKEGGLRIGEMERDCLICYGSSFLINERLMLSSDAITVDVCRQCGLFGYAKWCGYCKCSSTMSKLTMPYSCKLLFQELISMNIVPRISLKSVID